MRFVSWAVALATAAATQGALAQAQTPLPAPLPAPAKAALCTACHGEGGNATISVNPILAGQSARYLYLQLRDFQEGRRSDPQCSPMAAGLSREEVHALADYFAVQKPRQPDFKGDADKAHLGKAKADETLCTMCHQGGFAGSNEIPRVAGQHYDYVVKQLLAFKARHRTNDAGNMTSVASTLSSVDIENLAHYLAGL
jgi:cytochrome c553